MSCDFVWTRATLAHMARDTHTTVRSVRVDDELWLPFGRLVGERNRSGVIVQFIRWYLHLSDDLPARPELRGTTSPPAAA